LLVARMRPSSLRGQRSHVLILKTLMSCLPPTTYGVRGTPCALRCICLSGKGAVTPTRGERKGHCTEIPSNLLRVFGKFGIKGQVHAQRESCCRKGPSGLQFATNAVLDKVRNKREREREKGTTHVLVLSESSSSTKSRH